MAATIIGRIFFGVGIFVFLFLFLFQAVTAFANDYHIYGVQKKLQMSPDDSVIKDYYINAGTIQGLKKGAILKVFRRISMQDVFRNQTQDAIEVPVAEIKILFADRTMSVGRLHKNFRDDEFPVLNPDTIITGDKLDIKSMRFSEVESASIDTGPRDSAAIRSVPPSLLKEKVKPKPEVINEKSKLSIAPDGQQPLEVIVK